MDLSSIAYISKCQCCLEDLTSGSSLRITTSIKNIFLDFTSMDLMSSDRLSSRICFSCIDNLNKCYRIKKNFVDNQLKLQIFLLADPVAADLCAIKEEDKDEGSDDLDVEVKLELNWHEEIDPEFLETENTARAVQEKKSKRKSPKKLQQSPRQTKEKKLNKCTSCDFECKDKRTLENHKWKAHGGQAPTRPVIICEICSKEFKSRESFKRHQDKHNNVVRYFCDSCDYRTHTRMDITRHILTHLLNDPRVCFKCDYEGCSGVFRFKSSLNYHKQSVHLKATPFACHLCPKAFLKEVRLRQHIQFVHQKHRQIPCDIDGCESFFAFNSHLTRHKRQVHKIFVEKMQTMRN